MTPESGRVHLVGIGGMHMSAIAQLLLAEGRSVSGSDLVASPLTKRLEALGARIYEGHDPANVGGATLVVTTAAAKNDNVELAAARQRGIPVMARHEMVAQLMEGRTAIAVAGTHGKTTTSSLIALMLERAGSEPTYLLGGESLDLGGNAAAGRGPFIVVEADEYAGAFLSYHPKVAVITNVEADHLDYFGSEDCLIQAFRSFADNVPGDGTIVACSDSPILRTLLGPDRPRPAASVRWYGLDRSADWIAEHLTLRDGLTTFDVRAGGKPRGQFSLQVPGRHNVSNALAALAVADLVGLSNNTVLQTLRSFRGAHRRFELVGEVAGVTVIDDYAHHPTEVRATLGAARARYPNRRLVVLFQPHTYSRTKYLLDGFRSCFESADRLYLLQTFAARETAADGIDAFALGPQLRVPPAGIAVDLAEAVSMLAQQLLAGDVLFTMGAGNVTDVGNPLLKELRRR